MIFQQIVELLHLIEFIKLLSDNSIKKIIKYINKSYDWMYNHFPNGFAFRWILSIRSIITKPCEYRIVWDAAKESRYNPSAKSVIWTILYALCFFLAVAA